MSAENLLISRKRRIAGNVLLYLSGLLLTASAAAKFAQVPVVVAQLGAMGFTGNRLIFIAGLEAICAVLFLIPATRSAGLLLVSSYLGGAIASHLQHGQPIFQPAFVLTLLWLGAWLRHPEILWSLNRLAQYGNQAAQQKHTKTVLRQV